MNSIQTTSDEHAPILEHFGPRQNSHGLAQASEPERIFSDQRIGGLRIIG